MENDINSQEILCIKVPENPRKGILQLLDWGMNKIKKRIYFRTIRHPSFLFHSVMEFFTEFFLGHPTVHIPFTWYLIWFCSLQLPRCSRWSPRGTAGSSPTTALLCGDHLSFGQGQLDSHSCVNTTWHKNPRSKLHGNVVSSSTPQWS